MAFRVNHRWRANSLSDRLANPQHVQVSVGKFVILQVTMFVVAVTHAFLYYIFSVNLLSEIYLTDTLGRVRLLSAAQR